MTARRGGRGATRRSGGSTLCPRRLGSCDFIFLPARDFPFFCLRRGTFFPERKGCSALRRGSLSLFASGGLFSFSSERKEEKKRRQKLRFWISLRGFTCCLSCLFFPRERCAVEISPKCCTASASLFAAATALKCRAVQPWQELFLNGGPWPPPTFAAMRQRRDLIISYLG